MRIVKRCFVAGRVQGVYYRASTAQKARELGVHGFAKNLSDGRVEVLAVGEEDKVTALIDWLWIGSPPSHVTAVEVSDVKFESVQIPLRFETY